MFQFIIFAIVAYVIFRKIRNFVGDVNKNNQSHDYTRSSRYDSTESRSQIYRPKNTAEEMKQFFEKFEKQQDSEFEKWKRKQQKKAKAKTKQKAQKKQVPKQPPKNKAPVKKTIPTPEIAHNVAEQVVEQVKEKPGPRPKKTNAKKQLRKAEKQKIKHTKRIDRKIKEVETESEETFCLDHLFGCEVEEDKTWAKMEKKMRKAELKQEKENAKFLKKFERDIFAGCDF